jgi:hypothetical protein
MPRKPFEKGNKMAKGGKRVGAGRKPGWYKELAQKIVDRKKLIQRLGKFGAGEAFETRVIEKDGATIKVKEPPSFGEQIQAIDKLLDRGFGKPKQEVELSGGIDVNMADVARKARLARGLQP